MSHNEFTISFQEVILISKTRNQLRSKARAESSRHRGRSTVSLRSRGYVSVHTLVSLVAD
jgi:hypothetical protein